MNKSSIFRHIELNTGICTQLKEATDNLAYILSGNITAYYAKNKLIDLAAGDTFLMPKDTFVQLKVEDKSVLIFMKIEDITRHFSDTSMKIMIDTASDNEHGYCNILKAKGHLHEWWSLISLYLKDGINMRDIDQLMEDQFFILMKEYYTAREISDLLHPLFDESSLFAQLVKNNCLKTNSISELAQLTNYSSSGFIKKFQKCFREAPHQWITKFKAKRIMQDICFTQDYFCEISDKYGFASQSYFYTFCKKHYGQTPTELRKQGRIRINKGKISK